MSEPETGRPPMLAPPSLANAMRRAISSAASFAAKALAAFFVRGLAACVAMRRSVNGGVCSAPATSSPGASSDSAASAGVKAISGRPNGCSPAKTALTAATRRGTARWFLAKVSREPSSSAALAER